MKNKIITQQDLIKQYPNVKFILGCDEVGFGSAAGPCTLGVTVLPIDSGLKVKDSKKYSSHNARKKAEQEVLQKVDKTDIYSISPQTINEQGLGPSKNSITIYLLKHWLLQFSPNEIIAVVDGGYVPKLPHYLHSYTILPIPKADINITACSAASVIAKVHRDEYMINLHTEQKYSMYNFNINKGYVTAEHMAAIKQYGVSDQHRLIKPVRSVINGKKDGAR